MFDVRYVQIIVVTLINGGFNGTVVVEALVAYRFITISGTFDIVVVFVVTGTVAVLVTAASGVIPTSVA